MIDFNCHMQLKMVDALIIEESLYLRYTFTGGKKTKEEIKKTLLKVRKIIKTHKGYENHKFNDMGDL